MDESAESILNILDAYVNSFLQRTQFIEKTSHFGSSARFSLGLFDYWETECILNSF